MHVAHWDTGRFSDENVVKVRRDILSLKTQLRLLTKTQTGKVAISLVS